MIQKLTNRLTDRKKDNKGFTLVELIVVIVILAILAALLVPAMVGWIDKAKEKSYAVEARAVYLAAQTYESEHYDGTAPSASKEYTSTALDDIKELSGVNVESIKGVTFDLSASSNAGKCAIIGMTVQFKPAGKADSVTMQLAGGEWKKTT